MAKCVDCIYAKPLENMIWKCTKTGKKFDYGNSDPSACSKFRSDKDESNSCYQCDYYTDGFFGQRCRKTGNKVNEDDRACRHFRDV